MLFEFVTQHREEIIQRCRAKVATRSVPTPTEAEIEHGVPYFLAQLVEELTLGLPSRPASGTSEIAQIARLHGHDLLRQGFTVSQVVHDYGDVCQVITELAIEAKTPISTEDFRTLNRCLDDAIAGAVAEYGRQHLQSGIDGESTRGSERLGFLVHELRNLTQTALVAFEVLKTGSVGIAGNTGNVLHRTLLATRDLIAHSVTEIRLTQDGQRPEQLSVAAFIQDIVETAALLGNPRGVHLAVLPFEDRLTIEGDRQILSAALTNLLQNAFKFTRPHSKVTLRVRSSAERILFEVQDECGGLPAGDVNDLFHPFEQRGADRSGLGLGLAFSRWAVEMNHGRLYARTIHGEGCVFTVDMPRVTEGAIAAVAIA
jgi:signal transduction histidine kinase